MNNRVNIISEKLSDWYINKFRNYLDEKNKYKGWVNSRKEVILDLKKEEDFLGLFFLTSAWSFNGPWENAVAIIRYLKNEDLLKTNFWKNPEFVKKQIDNIPKLNLLFNDSKEIPKRRKIYIRNDIFPAFHEIAKKWEELKELFKPDELNGEYIYDSLRSKKYEGFAGKNKILNIKIFLLLRELRCQNIKKIDGKYCCVPDQRVLKMLKVLKMNIPSKKIKRSEFIYSYFGDLYDLPLFEFWNFCFKNEYRSNKDFSCDKCFLYDECITKEKIKLPPNNFL